ncbi:hypothetical protein TNCV_1712251 [Trichonephila clavipes]|nr:hypothetical protein TNCV_1712251 [Trichonephila clavipes]
MNTIQKVSTVTQFDFIEKLETRKVESEPYEIGNVIEEVANLARKINLEVKSENVQELLDAQYQELTIDELIEIHEQDQDIEELESVDTFN